MLAIMENLDMVTQQDITDQKSLMPSKVCESAVCLSCILSMAGSVIHATGKGEFADVLWCLHFSPESIPIPSYGAG